MQPITRFSPIILLVLSSLLVLQASGQNDGRENKDRKDASTSTNSRPAWETASDAAITDPLVRILVSKGILNDREGRSLTDSGTPIDRRKRLEQLLRDKGIITAGEFESLSSNAV